MRRRASKVSFRDLALSAFFAFGIVWASYLLWGIFGKEERARSDVADTKAQLASLESRESTLQGDLDELNTPRGKEAALRDNLGVARPGEDVIIVVPPTSPTSSTTTLPWWRRLFNWF
jgi:cell division protein FtsB